MTLKYTRILGLILTLLILISAVWYIFFYQYTPLQYKKYTNSEVGLSFYYPREFGEVTTTKAAAEKGTSLSITFTKKQQLSGGVITRDLQASRGSTEYEMLTDLRIKNDTCSYPKNSPLVSCEMIKSKDGFYRWIAVIGNPAPSGPELSRNTVGIFYFPKDHRYKYFTLLTTDTSEGMRSLMKKIFQSVDYTQKGENQL